MGKGQINIADILPLTMRNVGITNHEVICICGKIYNRNIISGDSGDTIQYIELCNFKVAKCCWQKCAERLSNGGALADLIIQHAEGKYK